MKKRDRDNFKPTTVLIYCTEAKDLYKYKTKVRSLVDDHLLQFKHHYSSSEWYYESLHGIPDLRQIIDGRPLCLHTSSSKVKYC